MGTIGSRIKEKRLAAKMTQAALARLVGVERAAVSQWETGQSKTLKGENLLKVAEALGVSPRWLSSGKDSPFSRHTSAGRTNTLHVGETAQPFRKIPLTPSKSVPVVHIRNAELFLRNPDKEGLAMIETTSDVDTGRAFAIEVPGDGGARIDLPGVKYAIVDPTKTPKNGDYVFVKLTPDETPTVRTLQTEGGERLFCPLNKDYKIVSPPESEILGKVVEIKIVVPESGTER